MCCHRFVGQQELQRDPRRFGAIVSRKGWAFPHRRNMRRRCQILRLSADIEADNVGLTYSIDRLMSCLLSGDAVSESRSTSASIAVHSVVGAARHATAADKPVNRDNIITISRKTIDSTILWPQSLLYLLLYGFSGYTRRQEAMLLITFERQDLMSSGNVVHKRTGIPYA